MGEQEVNLLGKIDMLPLKCTDFVCRTRRCSRIDQTRDSVIVSWSYIYSGKEKLYIEFRGNRIDYSLRQYFENGSDTAYLEVMINPRHIRDLLDPTILQHPEYMGW